MMPVCERCGDALGSDDDCPVHGEHPHVRGQLLWLGYDSPCSPTESPYNMPPSRHFGSQRRKRTDESRLRTRMASVVDALEGLSGTESWAVTHAVQQWLLLKGRKPGDKAREYQELMSALLDGWISDDQI